MSFSSALKTKDFLIVAETPTPKGVDMAGFVDNALALKGRVDAVLIPDMSHAIMRLSALAGAAVLKQHGLDSIVAFCCRDRNRLALQGDLLGAHVLGLNNIMARDGEPIVTGDQPDAAPVSDLDSAGLLDAAVKLSAGRDLGGKELKGKPRFCLGAWIEPWEDAGQAAVRAAEAKAAVENGASFLVTPPIYQAEDARVFMDAAGGLDAPVLASVLLLKSVGMARYINQNLPGPGISEATIGRIRGASDRAAECVKIAAETMEQLKGLTKGALLVAAGWEDRYPDILDAAASL